MHYAALSSVRVYAAYAHPVTFGVISNFDVKLSVEGTSHHLPSEVQLARIRGIGKSTLITLTFHENEFSKDVLLDHVRHQVGNFRACPL